MRALVPVILALLLLAGCASTPPPDATPAATAACTGDDCAYTADEGSYLVAVTAALGEDAGWWEANPSATTESQAEVWLGTGQLVCDAYADGRSDADVLAALEPVYADRALYPAGFAEAVRDAARDRLCA